MMRLATLALLGLLALAPEAESRRIASKKKMEDGSGPNPEALSKDFANGDQSAEKGLKSSWDNPNGGMCPRWKPELGARGGSLPSLVYVTIRSVQDLPWSVFGERPDPYVEFWMGEEGERQSWLGYHMLPGHKPEKYWRAQTPHIDNNYHPAWEWSCLMAYSNSNINGTKFNAALYDHDDMSRDDAIGFATADLMEILAVEDQRGTGEVDVKFKLKSPLTGEPLKSGPHMTSLNVKFEIISEKKFYSIREGHSMNHESKHDGFW